MAQVTALDRLTARAEDMPWSSATRQDQELGAWCDDNPTTAELVVFSVMRQMPRAKQSVQDSTIHTRLCLARVVGPDATAAALRGER